MATLKEGKFLFLYPLNPFLCSHTDIKQQDKLIWTLCHCLAKVITLINKFNLQQKCLLLDPIEPFGKGFGISIDRHQMWIQVEIVTFFPCLKEEFLFVSIFILTFSYIFYSSGIEINCLHVMEKSKYTDSVQLLNNLREQLHQKWG